MRNMYWVSFTSISVMYLVKTNHHVHIIVMALLVFTFMICLNFVADSLAISQRTLYSFLQTGQLLS